VTLPTAEDPNLKHRLMLSPKLIRIVSPVSKNFESMKVELSMDSPRLAVNTNQTNTIVFNQVNQEDHRLEIKLKSRYERDLLAICIQFFTTKSYIFGAYHRPKNTTHQHTDINLK